MEEEETLSSVLAEMGYDGEEKNFIMRPMTEKIEEANRDLITRTTEKRNELIDTIEDMKVQCFKLIDVLGGKAVDKKKIDDLMLIGTLRYRYERLIYEYDKLKTICNNRYYEFESEFRRSRQLFDILEIPKGERGEFKEIGVNDLSNDRLSKFISKNRELEDEIRLNNLKADDLTQEIMKVIQVTGDSLSPNAEVAISQRPITPSGINVLEKELARLKANSEEYAQKIKEFALEIQRLWDVLKIPKSVREEFIQENTTCGFQNVMNCVTLINELNEIRNKEIVQCIQSVEDEIRKVSHTMNIDKFVTKKLIDSCYRKAGVKPGTKKENIPYLSESYIPHSCSDEPSLNSEESSIFETVKFVLEEEERLEKSPDLDSSGGVYGVKDTCEVEDKSEISKNDKSIKDPDVSEIAKVSVNEVSGNNININKNLDIPRRSLNSDILPKASRNSHIDENSQINGNTAIGAFYDEARNKLGLGLSKDNHSSNQVHQPPHVSVKISEYITLKYEDTNEVILARPTPNPGQDKAEKLFELLDYELLKLKNLEFITHPIIELIEQREKLISEYNHYKEEPPEDTLIKSKRPERKPLAPKVKKLRDGWQFESKIKKTSPQKKRTTKKEIQSTTYSAPSAVEIIEADKSRRRYETIKPRIERKLAQFFYEYNRITGENFMYKGTDYTQYVNHVKLTEEEKKMAKALLAKKSGRTARTYKQ